MKVRVRSMFTKLLVLLAVLLLVGNATLGIFVYSRSESALFEQIQINAMSIAKCAAANVSGDILKEIAHGEEESEAYATILDELAFFRDNAEIEYIYTLRNIGGEQYEFVVDSDLEEPAAIGEECEFTEALGKAYTDKATTADDEPFTDEWGSHISAYSPVLSGDTVTGVVGVDISATWIEEQLQALRNLVIIICIVVYLVSFAILSLLVSKLKKGMNTLSNKVEELAGGSGDLTKEIDIYSKDEIGKIAADMNVFIRQIRTLVQEVAHSTEDILQTGEELSVTVRDNTQIMADMNSEITGINENMEKTATSSRELSQSLSENANHIAAFAKDVDDICRMVQQANENAQTTSAMAKENRKNAMDSIRTLREKMIETSKDAQKIEQVKTIAEEISNIASQTQMLSLNAQIEAARAGSMGAGFAVVATEVGNLSNDIDRAVTEINSINVQVLSAVKTLTEVLEEMITFVSEDVAKDYDSFAALGEEYGSTTDVIQEQMSRIGSRSKQISQDIADIDSDIRNIAAIVAQTAESANELAHSTTQVAESFENLNATSQKNSMNSENLNGQISKYTF
ncbi:MAG: methyl-accepting chemotaxis protein [Lachnospiraceae bacterium]|nr:methyl-accepting chemotaxis protein [Lachnospiraceae bacterium]